jgi:hypothetical protein
MEKPVRMTWYRKILLERKEEILTAVSLAILLAFAIAGWYFLTGRTFEWYSISPVEAPSLLPRLFYSALVYVSLGAILYSLGFYKFLYSLYRGTRGGYRAYKEMKGLIWLLLILGMYFIIVPLVVDILNNVISFLYNLLVLLIYLLPSIGITLVLSLGYFIAKRFL